MYVYNHRCFKTHYDASVINTNIKLYVETKILYEMNNVIMNDVIIELPRQLLKIHEIHENAICSLWELALRKVYTDR